MDEEITLDRINMGYIVCLLAVRESLINLTSDELVELFYKDKNNNEDTDCIESFLRTLIFLLENDYNYLYLGKDVYKKIYDTVSSGRLLVNNNKEEIYEMSNIIISKLNRLDRSSYDFYRKRYLYNQIALRTGEKYDDDEFSSDEMENIVKEYILKDRIVFMSFFDERNEFIIDDSNIHFYLSSLSYFFDKLTALFEDEERLKFLAYIKFTLDQANQKQFSKKIIPRSIYENNKLVLSNIQVKLNTYFEKEKVSNSDIAKLKVKAKASIH